MKFVAVIAGVALFAVALIPNAWAAGPAFSGVTANADSAETVVSNPAGMMRFKEPGFFGNPMFFFTTSETELTVENTGKKYTASDDSVIAMPGFYYVRPLNDRWAFGIGPNAALGLGATYDDNWVGRYLLEEWSLTFAGIAPSVAYRVNDKFSVGASLQIMYSQYNLKKAVYNLDPEAEDGTVELDCDGWGAGITVGMLYEPTEETRFGLVYRSKVSVEQDGKPEFSDLTAERRELLNKFGALDKEISFDTSTPQMMTAGVFHDFQNGWSFSLDGVWVDFSDWGFEDIQVGDSEVKTRPTDYKDILGATVGVNYEVSPKWTTRAGAFYTSAPLDEEDRTLFTRFDQMWGVGFGLEYKWNKRSIAFDLTYLQFGDGKFAVKDVPVVGDITGEYTTNYGIVLGIGTKW